MLKAAYYCALIALLIASPAWSDTERDPISRNKTERPKSESGGGIWTEEVQASTEDTNQGLGALTAVSVISTTTLAANVASQCKATAAQLVLEKQLAGTAGQVPTEMLASVPDGDLITETEASVDTSIEPVTTVEDPPALPAAITEQENELDVQPDADVISELPIEFEKPLIIKPYIKESQPTSEETQLTVDESMNAIDEPQLANEELESAAEEQPEAGTGLDQVVVRQEIDMSNRLDSSRYEAPGSDPAQAPDPGPELPPAPPAWLENLLQIDPDSVNQAETGNDERNTDESNYVREVPARYPSEEKLKVETQLPVTSYPVKPKDSSIETRIDQLTIGDEVQARIGGQPDNLTSMNTLQEGSSFERTLLLAPAAMPSSTSWNTEFTPARAPVQLALPTYPARMPPYDVGARISVLQRGNPALKQIALTFDDGPHPEFTSQILSVLDHYEIPATFFFVGLQSQKYPQWVQMTHQAGHEIASQTYDHFRMPKLPLEEKIYQIDEYQRLIEGLTGVTPRFLRPPGGQLDDETMRLIDQRNMVLGLWDVALNDTKNGRTPEDMLDIAFSKVRPGSVFLAHDGIQATVDMLPELIESLQAKGYTFVTMSEMAAAI